MPSPISDFLDYVCGSRLARDAPPTTTHQVMQAGYDDRVGNVSLRERAAIRASFDFEGLDAHDLASIGAPRNMWTEWLHKQEPAGLRPKPLYGAVHSS